MPNWVYNRLTVKGETKNLKSFSEMIGGEGLAIDFPKLATIVPRTWDTRDERSDSRVEKTKDGLIYYFDTAWAARADLVRDLSKSFPTLNLELYFLEETEQFAGALVCKAGKLVGEAYLGDEELQDFWVSTDEWRDEEEEDEFQDVELDKDSLEGELLKRAHAGSFIDWEARKVKLTLLRSDVETATLTKFRSRIQDLTSNAKLNPPKNKLTDDALCKAIRAFESNYSYRQHADIELVPREYLSEWVALQFCMTHDSNWKKLPKSLQTQTFWDKYIKCKETLSTYYNPPLKKVPPKFRSDSLVRYALKHDLDALGSLKPTERTPERCKLAVRRYGQQIKHVPQTSRTEELCRIAVTDDGMSLQHVPKHQRTSKLCELATYKGKGYTAMAIQFVPSKLITAKMLEHFINSPRGRAYENSLEPRWIPVRFRSFEILKELLPTQPKLLSAIKPEILEKLWVIEGYPARLVKSSGWCFNWFEHIPQALISKDLYEYVVQNLGPTYFKNLPDDYKSRVLCLEAFNASGSEILPYVPKDIFDREFCKTILKQDFHCSTWKLNGSQDEIKEFIQEIPALFIPKNLWNESLVKLAKQQTIFSILALPTKWVSLSEFEKVINEDHNLFHFFDAQSQKLFEKEYENIVSTSNALSSTIQSKLNKLLSKIEEIESSILNGSKSTIDDKGKIKRASEVNAELSNLIEAIKSAK
jgi:hypothetical protein